MLKLPDLTMPSLQAPAPAARVLEYMVGVSRAGAESNEPKNAVELAGLELVRRQQKGLRGGKELLVRVHEKPR